MSNRMKMTVKYKGWVPIMPAIAGLILLFTGIAAWLTHVVWIIHKLASDAGATVGQMVLGVLGTFVPPVGVIHGIILWFS